MQNRPATATARTQRPRAVAVEAVPVRKHPSHRSNIVGRAFILSPRLGGLEAASARLRHGRGPSELDGAAFRR